MTSPKPARTAEPDERFAVRFEPDIEECFVGQGKCLVGQEEYLVGQEECLAGQEECILGRKEGPASQEECLLGREEGLVGQEQRTILMVSDHQVMILYNLKTSLDHQELDFINENC